MPDYLLPADATTSELAQELAYTRLLQSISTQLIADQPIEILYECLAAAAATLLRSDFASLQMLHPERNGGELRLLAHRGFSAEAAACWEWVPRNAATSCGAALQSGQRVIIPDVEACEFMTGTPNLTMHQLAGIRAAQSTPLYARDGRLVGMLTTHWRHVHVPSERQLSLLDILARQAADLIERRRAEDALREAHDLLEQRVAVRTREVRELLGRLVNSQEEERRRISREIHDQMGQQITALRMNIELLTRTSVTEQGTHTQRLAEALDHSIDFLAWELRPAALDELGLGPALKTLIMEWSARFGIAADYRETATEGIVEGPRLDRDIEFNIYRVVQEALHNVHKHSGAAHVGVRFEWRHDELLITVKDDGCGFPVRADSGHTTARLGLVGMRERAALIGGAFRIESSPGQGTTALLRLPSANTPFTADARSQRDRRRT